MTSEETSRAIIASVEREIAEMEAADAAVAAGLAQRRVRAGRTVVFSVRLDGGEVDALERRAAAIGLKPTVLARNLIRIGLSQPMGPVPGLDRRGQVGRVRAPGWRPRALAGAHCCRRRGGHRPPAGGAGRGGRAGPP